MSPTLRHPAHWLWLFALCATFANASDLEFWNGAKEGMSERDVHKLFPAATKPADPESLVTGTLNNFRLTAFERLRDCTLAYEGLPACGRFYFEDKKLVGVDLELRDLDRTQPAKTAELGAQLRDKLAQKFGVDPTCQYFKATEMRGPAGTCEWHTGGERIGLSYFHGLMPKISATDKVTVTISFRRETKPS
jgi:hypothetical protein